MNLIKLLHFPKPSALMTVATSALSLIAACSSTPNSNGGGAGGNDGGAANGGAGLGGEGGMAGAAGTGGAGSAGSGGMAGAGGTGGAGGEGGGGPKSLYLVSIDHKASPSVLLKVDIATGVGKVACTLPSDVDPINYHSTTFSRTGVLFASNYQDARIDTIDPCTCAITPVGPTGFTSIPGITVNHGTGLFGVETTSDILLDIDTLTGNATKIGDLGVDFTTAGATWSDALNNGQGGLFGINGATNSLYSINPTTGSATVLAPINGVTFTSVGIEMHPANDTIYACTDDAVLYAIDQATGTATGIGTGMGHVSSCNNLAAPWLAVKCLDAL